MTNSDRRAGQVAQRRATLRAYAGSVFAEEVLVARGLVLSTTAIEATGLSRNTLTAIIKGDPSVTPVSLAAAEAAMGWPRGLLDAIGRGDVGWITRRYETPPAGNGGRISEKLYGDLLADIPAILAGAERDPGADFGGWGAPKLNRGSARRRAV